MLKGKMLQGGQAKATAPVRRSVLVSASLPARRKYLPFKSAGRASFKPLAAQAGEAKPTKMTLAEVQTNTQYEGKVVKVEAFGAFVDFGAEAQGLVHISQLSDGFVKSAQEFVKVGDTVKVRVLSVDAAAKRIALSMKGQGARAEREPREQRQRESAPVEVDYSQPLEVEELDEDDVRMPKEGYTYVFADGLGDDFPFEMEENAITEADLEAFEEADDFEVTIETDTPVPMQELVQANVVSASTTSITVDFLYNGQKYTGTIDRDELKVPAAALTADQRAELEEDGEELGQFVEIDEVDDASKYYKAGDQIPALVLEYTADGAMSLTMFSNDEVQADALALMLEEDEDEDMEVPVLGIMDEEPSITALDPLEALAIAGGDDEDDVAAAAADGELNMPGVEDNELVTEYVTIHKAKASGLHFKDVSMFNLPSRPEVPGASYNLYNYPTKVVDFEGDTVVLDDVWEESFKVPKNAMKRMGLKIVFNEQGEGEVVERKDKKELTERDIADLFGNPEAGAYADRAPKWVKDMLADDEDEAELPVFAMRRPVCLAAAAGISATAVKELRDKTGAGMMDCKKALAETDGDTEKAIEVDAAATADA